MNNELLEEIRNRYKEKHKVEEVCKMRIYQLDLIGKLRTKYYTIKQSKHPEERKLASLYMDERINNFFYVLTRNKRKLTDRELDYLTEFFCNAPPV